MHIKCSLWNALCLLFMLAWKFANGIIGVLNKIKGYVMVHYNNLKATGHRNWGKSFELFQNNDGSSKRMSREFAKTCNIQISILILIQIYLQYTPLLNNCFNGLLFNSWSINHGSNRSYRLRKCIKSHLTRM